MRTEARQRTDHRHYMELKARAMKKFTPVEESGRWAPKCARCGEEDLDVLCFHHENLDGKEHRDQSGYGRNLLEYALYQGQPEEFKVLCANCHMKAHKKFPTP